MCLENGSPLAQIIKQHMAHLGGVSARNEFMVWQCGRALANQSAFSDHMHQISLFLL